MVEPKPSSISQLTKKNSSLYNTLPHFYTLALTFRVQGSIFLL